MHVDFFSVNRAVAVMALGCQRNQVKWSENGKFKYPPPLKATTQEEKSTITQLCTI